MGKPPDFTKKRFRWVGDSYRVYSRDTDEINEQHRDALKASLEVTMALKEHVENAVLERAGVHPDQRGGGTIDIALACPRNFNFLQCTPPHLRRTQWYVRTNDSKLAMCGALMI